MFNVTLPVSMGGATKLVQICSEGVFFALELLLPYILLFFFFLTMHRGIMGFFLVFLITMFIHSELASTMCDFLDLL